MDDSVIAAIARWPNVPHVYGWLSLDRRGRWRLQDSPISNPHITDFIARNYEHDERGAWFFQNGPQRVYVKLEYTPWVSHIGDNIVLTTHTGLPMEALTTTLLDEQGNLLIGCEHGISLLDDRDLAALLNTACDRSGQSVDEEFLNRVMAGEVLPIQLRWGGNHLPLLPVRSEEIAERFMFISDPVPEHES